MNKFETFLSKKGIPIGDVTTPFERLLMRMGLISMPIGLLNYSIRSIWFSIAFTALFLGFIELVLEVLAGISFFTSVPPLIIFISVCILLSFGPIAAYFKNKSIEKHRSALMSFLSEQ